MNDIFIERFLRGNSNISLHYTNGNTLAGILHFAEDSLYHVILKDSQKEIILNEEELASIDSVEIVSITNSNVLQGSAISVNAAMEEARRVRKPRTIKLEDLKYYIPDYAQTNKGPVLKAKYKIRYFRNGFGYVKDDNANFDDYRFNENDIIDDEICDQIKEESLPNHEMQDIEILCFVDKNRRIAHAITLARTIDEHLAQVRKLKDLYHISYEKQNLEEARFRLYQARYVIDFILDEYPTELKAISQLKELKTDIDDIEEKIKSSKKEEAREDIEKEIYPSGEIISLPYKSPSGDSYPGKINDYKFKKKGLTFFENSWIEKEFLARLHQPVMYSLKQKTDGTPIVWCMHSVMSLDEMIDLADDLYNNRGMKQEAWGVIKQVLEIEGNNREAIDRLKEYESQGVLKDETKRPRLIKLSGNIQHNTFHEQALELKKNKDLMFQAIDNFKKAIKDYKLQKDKVCNNTVLDNTIRRECQANMNSCIKEIDNIYKELLSSNNNSLTASKDDYREFIKTYFPMMDINDEACMNLYMSTFHDTQYNIYEGKEYFNYLFDLLSFLSHKKGEFSKKKMVECYALLSRAYLKRNTPGDNQEANRNNKRAFGIDVEYTCRMALVNRAIINGRFGPNEKCREEEYYIMPGNSLCINPIPLEDNMESDINHNKIVIGREYYQTLFSDVTKKKSAYFYRSAAKALSIYLAKSESDIYSFETNEGECPDIKFHEEINQCIRRGLNWPRWREIMDYIMIKPEQGALIENSLFDQNREFASKLVCKFKEELPMNCTKMEYAIAFEKIRQQLYVDYTRWNASFSTLSSTNPNLQTLKTWIEMTCLAEDWMSDFDKTQAELIYQNFPKLITNFINAGTARSKENAYYKILTEIERRQIDIQSNPTLLTMLTVNPLLNLIKEAIETVHREPIYCNPKLTMSLLSVSAINDINECEIQVEIKNTEIWARDISELKIPENKNKGIKVISLPSEELYGGEHGIMVLRVHVDPSIPEDNIIQQPIICEYLTSQNASMTESTLKIPIIRHFNPIENNLYVGYGQKAWDNKMFVGRDNLINEIVSIIENTPASQILAYGQKRSGKSSLLFHLRLILSERKVLRDSKGHFTKTSYYKYAIPKYLVANTSYLGLGEQSIRDTRNPRLTSEIDGAYNASYDDGIMSTTDNAYFQILSAFEDELESISDSLKLFQIENKINDEDAIKLPEFKLPKRTAYGHEAGQPYDKFVFYLRMLKKNITHTPGWENIRLVVLIDEFTSLHKAIKDNYIDPNFMLLWKRLQENEETQFSSILIGQDVMPSLLHDYSNVYASFPTKHIGYLNHEDAISLIEKQTLEDGTSRFVSNASERVYYYTSGNPYYIWKLSYELIKNVNMRRCHYITVHDVDVIATECYMGFQPYWFDNLILAGEDERVSLFPSSLTENILIQIAKGCAKNGGVCPRALITVKEPNENDETALTDAILTDLDQNHRGIILAKDGNYEIIVKLYEKWLCYHK